ncbi:MAG: rod shape-determining protein MreD [Verrucomicrobiota bacterium]
MNPLDSILILAATFLAVFAQSAFHGLHHLLGAQINLLPALIVCASLRQGMTTMIGVAALGGLCFDSLSQNPLGISVLPLFIAGFIICWQSELILRDQAYAQLVLGFLASAAVPLMTLLLLLTSGHTPLLGWGSLWQWLVISVAGMVATPVLFRLLDWFEYSLSYRRATESSFRHDREIRRGRK